jgi:ATP adenylyltransferase/5',5'''-P-1,P-4-tetraphosphate phosphorylase II
MVCKNALPFYIRHIDPAPFALQPPSDPFQQPIDPNLFIQDLSNTHSLIFNKYTIIKHHLLIVSKGYEPQHQLLLEQGMMVIQISSTP